MGCWSELLPPEDLFCVLPYYPVRARIISHLSNRYGVDIQHTLPEEQGGAWSYDPPLKEPGDYDRLVRPVFSYDKEGSEERQNSITRILGDVLPVRIINSPAFDEATAIGTMTAELRGLENFMIDTVLQRKFLHKMSAYLRDVQSDYLDCMEKAGISEPNTFQPVLMYPLPDKNPSFFSLKHCMTSANSQEYDQVSPESFEEFLLAYQLPLLNRFGLAAYGCCENLTQKLDIIKKRITKLRIITCSAWTYIDVLLEKMSPEYCIMWRQKATDVVLAKNENELRRSLEAGCEKLKNRPYQIVLRELETLNGDRERLHRWTRIANEAQERWS